MNLNEECLLNYLKNPDEINNLSTLIGEYFLQNMSEKTNMDYNFLAVTE